MYLKIKRLLDILCSILAIIIFLPLFIILSILIKTTSKGPLLFKQKRIGQNKKHFYILKFRTMKENTPSDIPTHLLNQPDAWITPIGKFLRKTSLDELPQLWNILVGEMSIIGPRPALWNQYDLIEKRDHYQANNLKPGLSGWAQVNGRDELSINEKAKFDGEYVEQLSFLMDIKCFFKTIQYIFKRQGIIEGKQQ